MREFEDYSPAVLFVCFFSAAGISMFCMNPLILFISFSGAFCLFFARNKTKKLLSHLYFLTLFAAMALINPVFSHNGATVIAVVNNKPITLEAFYYGLATSAMIISTIYWFRSFTEVMTGDKLLYLFSALSPKLALLVSMTLRYIPLFGRQTMRVNNAQKALGLYKDESLSDRIKGGIRVFSVMVTWALEYGIITADSMEARGYGIGKRTRFSPFRFRKADALMLLWILVLLALTSAGLAAGAVDYDYYPSPDALRSSALSISTYIAYAALCFTPSVDMLLCSLRWKRLRSRI